MANEQTIQLKPIAKGSYYKGYFDNNAQVSSEVARQGYGGDGSWKTKTKWQTWGKPLVGYFEYSIEDLNILQNVKISKIKLIYTAESKKLSGASAWRNAVIYLNEYNSSSQNFDDTSYGNPLGFFEDSTAAIANNKIYELEENSTGDDKTLFDNLSTYLQSSNNNRLVLKTPEVYWREDYYGKNNYPFYWDENYVGLTDLTIEITYSKGISSDTSEIIIKKDSIDPASINFTINEVTGATSYKIGFNNNIEITTINPPSLSYNWTINSNEKAKILKVLSSETEGSILVYCHPYNGQNPLSTYNSEVELSITIEDSIKPTISLNAPSEKNTNLSTLGLIHFLQGKSKIGFSISAIAGEEATIKDCQLNIFNHTYILTGEENTYTYDLSLSDSNNAANYGTFSYLITVTDSRNRTATDGGNIIIDRYLPPQIINFKAIQVDEDGASSLTGNYVSFQVEASATSLLSQNGTDQIENNNLTISITGKRDSSSSHIYYENDIINNTNVVNKIYDAKEIQGTVNDNGGKDNVFTLEIKDRFQTQDPQTQTSTLGQQTAVLDFVGDNSGKVGVAIGTTATADDIGCIRLGWPLKFKDETVRQETVQALEIDQPTLPIKVACGHGVATCTTNDPLQIDYTSAGFTQVPCVCVTYSQETLNDTGDNGIPKVFNKTRTGATIILSGSSGTRNVDWIAIQVLSSS